MPRVQIPQWFEHKNPGRPIRFWFRNDFPAIVACIAKSDFQGVFDYPDLSVFINGREHKHYGRTPVLEKPCTVLFHLLIEDDLDVSLLENEWNRAEIVCYGSWDECGIHVLKELSSMEDIRFTDPFRKEKFVVQRLRFGKKQRLARVKLLRHNL